MYKRILKRSFDIIFALILLPILLILFLPIALMIKLEDGGSILYRSIRLGKQMEPFYMYKFRTMHENAPDIRNADGTTYNSETDFRVTKVGRFLRKTSLDELPQIINVLLGEMSFVGPRPSPTGDKSIYPKEFFDKFKVAPGITGYSQALVRNCADMDTRIKNDSYYVEHLSFALDCQIIVLTAMTVLRLQNVYRNESVGHYYSQTSPMERG